MKQRVLRCTALLDCKNCSELIHLRLGQRGKSRETLFHSRNIGHKRLEGIATYTYTDNGIGFFGFVVLSLYSVANVRLFYLTRR